MQGKNSIKRYETDILTIVEIGDWALFCRFEISLRLTLWHDQQGIAQNSRWIVYASHT
jgi:hypothetical protein